MLTVTEIRNAVPGSKPQRLWDQSGLYLEVSPTGGKWWRFKYRFVAKEKRLSLGVFPEVSLKEARERRDEARKLVREGIDPSEARQKKKLAKVESFANSFEQVAREWFQSRSRIWVPEHADRIMRRFERDIFPEIGQRPVGGISARELLAALRRIETRGALATAKRALGDCQQVFKYAISTDRAATDPSSALTRALVPVKSNVFAAQTEPKEVGRLLALLEQYRGTPVVRAALRLQPLIFCRPGELRKAEWQHFDLDTGLWSYHITKTDTDIIFPLSKQALVILRDLKPITGRGRYVFPCQGKPDRPMSDAAALAAMRRLGISQAAQTSHGWRAPARTMIAERLKIPVEFIELQLGHRVLDPNGRAYDRTKFLDERTDMMQRWADYLTELKGMNPG